MHEQQRQLNIDLVCAMTLDHDGCSRTLQRFNMPPTTSVTGIFGRCYSASRAPVPCMTHMAASSDTMRSFHGMFLLHHCCLRGSAVVVDAYPSTIVASRTRPPPGLLLPPSPIAGVCYAHPAGVAISDD